MQASAAIRVPGMVWQPDNATANPQGNWHKLGVNTLLIQWLATMDGTGALWRTPGLPDLALRPWARRIIAGMVGDHDERRARSNVEAMIEASVALSKESLPWNPVGWYFPVESDPTWNGVQRMAALLKHLPRPLWISVYDNSNLGARTFAKWVATWLPADVGVFFQDGVGLYMRDARTAADYTLALADQIGWQRLRLIAEAFRPSDVKAADGSSRMRSATAQELREQLAVYANWPVFVFDGPHYLPPALVKELSATVL